MAKQINFDNRANVGTTDSFIKLKNSTNLNEWTESVVIETLNEVGVTTNGAVVPEWTEVVRSITTAEIDTMGATPIELLPAAGANSYYEYEITLEKTGTGKYTSTSLTFVGTGTSYVGSLGDANILDTNPVYQQFSSRNAANYYTENGVGDDIYFWSAAYNENIVLQCYSAVNPSVNAGFNDGDLKARIKYKVITAA